VSSQIGVETGRSAVALAAALVLTALWVDTTIDPPLGAVLAVGFAASCLVVALAVRPGDFFTVGVLPPLLMLGALALTAAARPTALPGTSYAERLVTGLADHSLALVLGWLVALAVLLTRSARSRPPRAG
jgi:hypothetical protein